eukprot:1160935-Pelagomonas_calceolata.AAC.8
MQHVVSLYTISAKCELQHAISLHTISDLPMLTCRLAGTGAHKIRILTFNLPYCLKLFICRPADACRHEKQTSLPFGTNLNAADAPSSYLQA